MNYRTLLGKEYLSAEDLPPDGVELTISDAQREEVTTDRGTEVKAALYFKELDERHRRDSKIPRRRMIVNQTNGKAIAELHGPEVTAWVGRKIILYPTTGTFFGKPNTPCIRVRGPSE